MALFMQECPVKYACSCGNLNPLSKLFFCRHCLKLRCGFCVCHEVDSHFCSNCLENIPSSEARHKKNCCANCFDCPCCGHTLSARATTVVVPKKPNESTPKAGEADVSKVVTKKMYYLSCLACRWTSRDVGIPDQAVATGAWPEKECPYQTRFDNLLEYYQAVVLQDKQEKQDYMRRRIPKVHKFPSLTDRTGLTVSMIRRQIGWADKNPPKVKAASIVPALATEDVGELPENIFTQKINLLNITTIKQRHGQPAEQPFSVNKLYPQRRFLWIKRSLRCRQCEHNVIKPEYHPTSIKYRIQLFANYHVPEIIFMRCEQPLKAGLPSAVILKFINPTMHEMTITIMELPTIHEELQMIEEFKNAVNIRDLSISTTANESLKSLTGAPSLNTSTISRQPSSLIVEPRMVSKVTNANLEMLDSSFVLNQRDDSAEFDEDVHVQREDLKFITWRKAHKVSIRLHFTPDSNLQPGDVVTLGLNMQYTYVNTVSNTPEKKESMPHALTSRVYVNVGTISETK